MTAAHASSSDGSSSAPPAAGGDGTWLFAFDFDHTVVDGNTDTHVVKALPDGKLPPEIRASPGRWTEYMQRVLAHLHAQGVTAEGMQQVLQQMPYTDGMEQLLQQLQTGRVAGRPCSCIILSDSNTAFIDWILHSRGHRDIFSHVYTNPAEVSQQRGVLVAPHHSHTCGGCPVNMCKRQVLAQHLAAHSRGPRPRVAYVGDGHNDLCPAQLLGPRDVLFVRAGFALDKLLAADAAVAATLAAHVCRWRTGADILQRLQQL